MSFLGLFKSKTKIEKLFESTGLTNSNFDLLKKEDLETIRLFLESEDKKTGKIIKMKIYLN